MSEGKRKVHVEEWVNVNKRKGVKNTKKLSTKLGHGTMGLSPGQQRAPYHTVYLTTLLLPVLPRVNNV